MEGSKKYTTVWDGLWNQKHVKKMGSSIFLFGFLLSRANRKGQVRITYLCISGEMMVPIRTLGSWMQTLKQQGYLTIQKSGSMIIQITNFRSTKKANFGEAVMQDVAEPKSEVMQDSAEPPCKTLPNLPQDSAEPKPVKPDKQIVSGSPLNVFKIKDKYNRPASKKPDISGSGKGVRKTRHLTYLREDKETAIFILGKIQNIQPKFKKPNLESWANDIRLTREQDKRTHEEIKSLFSWANKNQFWRSNILCPAKLRMKWDQLEIQRSSNGNGNGFRTQADINSASAGEVVL